MFGIEKKSVMTDYIEEVPTMPRPGDLVEGVVIGKLRSSLYVDLQPYGTGIIYGREYIMVRDLIKKIHHGDSVSAKVVDVNNKEGYIELSLKEAKQALVWGEVEDAIAKKTPIEVSVHDANKGGLILYWQGLQGFLPASQLTGENYPRVEDGDKDKILTELKKLVGQTLVVTIIGATPEDGKLIFSEKNTAPSKEKAVAIESIKEGDVLKGEITGMVDFGVFVKIQDGLEGLVHISEIDWALVEDPRKLFTVGEAVDVKVIEVKDGKVSLSIKALKENPWKTAGSTYNKGDIVEGIIIKYNKHGALAAIEEGVAGLVHISEFEDESDLRDKLELGKRNKFKITLFDPNEQKMTLSTKLED